MDKPTQIIRQQCLEHIKQLTLTPTYGIELERQLYHKSGRPTTVTSLRTVYYRLYTKLCFHLKINKQHLCTKYSPSQLVLLDDAQLAETQTSITDYKKLYKSQIDKYHQILRGTT